MSEAKSVLVRAQRRAEREKWENHLARDLNAAGIRFTRQYLFAPPRRWTFDFKIDHPGVWMAVEVDGGRWKAGGGKHGPSETECEKMNMAALNGWWVFHVTPAMVENGLALRWIELALGRRASLTGETEEGA